uniref:C-type lectin domain-containing protein n=1 Tax=Plectus sambesii TaxID=2011161 RepID=A0A914UKC9_9BILA
MRLMNAKGEEVMSYNDAFKDGYYYYDSRGYKTDDRHSGPGVRLESAKNNNSTFTLFIEVFVDTATIDCKPVQYGPFPSTKISEMCSTETLQTEQFLQYDGGCYVGSNSAMNYYNARLVCNHIPGASIARLAWVENATLLEKLHTALNTSFSPPNRIQNDDFAFLLGAFQMTDGLKLTLGTVRKDWWWINANDTIGKEIPEDWNMWSRAQPNDGDDKNERVIAFLPKRTTFVLYDYFELDENRYLCEYR